MICAARREAGTDRGTENEEKIIRNRADFPSWLDTGRVGRRRDQANAMSCLLWFASSLFGKGDEPAESS
jgi:hypothetical protein